MSKALWVKADGTRREVTPKNGSDFQLDELQEMVGGNIELVSTVDGRYIVADEEGVLKEKPFNELASQMYLNGHYAPIVGDVVICDREMIK